MKHRLLLLLLAAFPVSASAQKIIFTPQWTAQAQFAGYYVAQDMGFFQEEGLDVEIVHPSTTRPAMNRIRNNESQATTLDLCQAIEISAEGIPMVNILQTSMQNSLLIISQEGVDPLSQKGQRVGTWSIGFNHMALCMDRMEQLEIEWIPFNTNVNLFVTGALPSTLAMEYNEYYQLLQAGMSIKEEQVYRFADHGYNVQEDGVYMTRSYYRRHKQQAEAFAKACRRGWEWAAEHPEETLDIVMKYVHADHIATNRVMQKLMLQTILRLQLDKESGEREFRLRPDMVQLANTLLLQNHLIPKSVTYEDLHP